MSTYNFNKTKNKNMYEDQNRYMQGSIVAIVTPFTVSGKINKKKFKQLIKLHINSYTTAIVVAGTTGESPTLTHDEHNELLDMAVDYAGGKIPIIAGTGSNSTSEAVELTKYAKRAGADACLSVNPYYNKPSQRGIINHHSQIADVGLPTILYDVAGRSGINFDLDTTLELAEHENVIGKKYASGSIDFFTQMMIQKPPFFRVWSGDDNLTYHFNLLGGDGCISVVANLIPNKFGELMSQSMINSPSFDNPKTALRIHKELYKLMKSNFLENNPANIKHAMYYMGLLDECILRLPLTEPSLDIMNKQNKILNECKKFGVFKDEFWSSPGRIK
ncbi:4-hydroxy-tetrahydrodipicolinate synthase [Nanoarchaeota archaeon]